MSRPRTAVGRAVAAARRRVGGDVARATDDAADRSDAERGPGRAVAAGAVGGLLGTVVMTLYRVPVFRALPPTAEFWAQYVGGGEAEEYPVEGWMLHLLYGVTGGALFGPLHAAVAARLPDRPDLIGMVGGVGYGAALSVFGERVMLERLLGRELEHHQTLVFHAGHLVYGLTLGTWLGARERAGDVYDRPSEHADE